MGLLGIPLLVVLGCAAVLVPVATYLLWSRVRGPDVVRAATRLGMLGGAQLAAVLLVAALANDYGQFYTSWADLVGSPGGGSSVTAYGTAGPARTGGAGAAAAAAGTSRTGGRMRVLGNTSWSTPAQFASKGKVEQVSISGLASGLSETGYVYLPPQYFQARYAHTRFPAVETVGGYPGSALSQVTRMNYPGVSARLVAQGRSTPTIFVMMSSVVDPPRDTEGTNIPGGPQTETYFAQEVPSAATSALRVAPGDWGISGDSTGGYIATKILMDHHDAFRAGVSIGGYYHAVSDYTTGDLWGGSRVVKHANDPEWLLTHMPAPPVSLFVAISKQETGPYQSYADTMRFVHDVKPPMHVTALVLASGGHNFTTFSRELPTALTWMSHQLSAGTHPLTRAPVTAAATADE